MYGGYSSPPLTNNPFIASSSGHPSTRFPDISTPPTNPLNSNGSINGAGDYPQQQQGVYQQQQQYPQQPQYQPQPTMGYGVGQQQQPQQMIGGGGYISPAQSSFGQQLAASVNISGSSYGYLQRQQQQQQAQSYTPAQQQLQNNPGQGWDGNNASATGFGGSSATGATWVAQSLTTGSTISSSSFTSAPPGGYGLSPAGDPHPRDFVRTHKAEVEAWDSYAWKQLINSFDALKQAWDQRKNELTRKIGELSAQMSYGGGYYAAQIQQQGSRIQGLQKEAENNFDSVAASTFQIREVFSGYRQSGDLASKRRVREATNAALQGLPGWPQPY
ncbi:hypothetical protein CPB84DRAFT_1764147 [Gymnopilus junonius]|uniref:Uncharacterized protein n=1 Tax=Gymnopilus junonius TaxID=109634 RepID=A0A9P5NY92_GYMJU|nr:hypothetical protein CPB84DRAFT_1764147 [Gymnopilus junonius]